MKDYPVRDAVARAISKYPEIDEESIPAVALLAHGMTQTAVAKVLGVSQYAVGQWINTPGFLSAVAIVKENIDAWHRTQFSIAAALSWKKIIDLLSKDLEPGSAGYKDQIRLAESVVMKAMSSKDGFEQEEEETETTALQVHPASVDLIARRITEMQSGGAVAREEKNTRKIDLESMPSVIACHPSTNYGSMSYGSNGSYLCHVCGKEPNNFFDHIESTHGLDAVAYARTYGIDSQTFVAEYSR